MTNRLNFIPILGAVLAVIIGVIALVSVGTQVSSDTAVNMNSAYSFTNDSMTVVNGSYQALPAFADGTCGERAALTSLTNGNASAVYVDGYAYSLDANSGLVSYTQIDTAANGTTALATGTCYRTDTTTSSIVDLMPLFVALAALAYVAYQMLA